MEPSTPSSMLRRVVRGAGAYETIIALLAMPVLWFAFTRLTIIADAHRDDGVAVGVLCAWCVRHGAWAPLLALPALVHGVVLARRSTRHPGASVLLGLALLLLPAAVTFWCFVSLVAPLYRVREL